MFAETAFDHVMDTAHWHFVGDLAINLPLGLTKYKILLLAAALVLVAIFVPLAKKVQTGAPPRGRWWNLFESLLTFVRDQIARPNIGHDADHYVPFLWSLFLFILVNNLFGMIPFLGSATASISVTLALAAVTFCFIHGSAIAKMGFTHYLHSYVPHLDVPGLGIFIAVLEIVGNCIKGVVLAIRLFANMFSGHLILATILMFIVMVKDQVFVLFWGVTSVSVLGVIALSFLELLVAFLQAFIFTFLTAIFLGMAVHPSH
jgi:F-type H+-transporting ATPase subunit a